MFEYGIWNEMNTKAPDLPNQNYMDVPFGSNSCSTNSHTLDSFFNW